MQLLFLATTNKVPSDQGVSSLENKQKDSNAVKENSSEGYKINNNVSETTSKKSPENLNEGIDINPDGTVDLIDLLEVLSVKFDVKFKIAIKDDIKIKKFNFNLISLEDFLIFLRETAHLHNRVDKKNKQVFIFRCKPKWREFHINFISPESISERKANEIVKLFWDELEKELKVFGLEKFNLNRKTSVLRALCNCEQEQQIENFVNDCNRKTCKKIKVKCQILQVVHDKNFHFDLSDIIQKAIPQNITAGMSNTKKNLEVANAIFSTIQANQSKNNNLNVSFLTNIMIDLLNKIPTSISSKEEKSYERSGFGFDGKEKINRSVLDVYSEGLFFEITPTVLSDGKIMFTIDLSLDNLGNLEGKAPTVKKRSLKTNIVMNNKPGEYVVLCGLESTLVSTEKTFENSFLNTLFGSTTQSNLESKIIIVLTINS